MKYLLILPLVLILTGCTDSGTAAYDAVVALQKETQLNLTSCKNSLEVYRGGSSGSTAEQPQQQSEPEQPAEPQCDDVEYDVMTQGGKKLDTCKSDEVVAKECGIMAVDCESGLAYACLRDVTYKTITKKVCN